MVLLDKLRLVVLIGTRVISLSYVVLALFNVKNVRGLLKTESSYDGDTYIIPLIQCTPEDIEIGSSTYSASLELSDNCNTYSWLVNAAAAGLILSALGTVFFLVIDVMARRGKGPFGKSTALGMGMLLIFLLIQAGLSIGAIWREASFWVDSYQIIVEAADMKGKAKVHANVFALGACTLFAFFSAFFIFLDVSFTIFNKKDSTASSFSVNKPVNKPVESPSPPSVPLGGSQPSKTDAPHWSSVS